MTRRPLFWVVFAALGLAGAVTALRLFTDAFPTVSLQIDMDRDAAIAQAAALSQRHGWGPASARSAASFGQVDPEVQTYVELEGGGAAAFQQLLDAGVYQPYRWRVRRFAEGAVEEVEVAFTPHGTPYGFSRILSEDDPGSANLDAAAARAVAEEAAAAWPVGLAPYTLVESSQRTEPGGRVDHTFVYERSDVRLADARFRLRLVVSGDTLSELTHFVLVPEAFSQRYADMRSTNDAIALVAQAFFILVYVLLGAGLGTALLLRQRWVEWRTALAWGSATAFLFGLNSLNALPLAWMSYDTALSASTFVFQNVALAGAIALLGAPVLAFFFLAGESLGRRAFPEHLQQWRFWSPRVAASRPALGITVGAYLLVGVQLGYVTLFYLGTSRLEGWWSPAEALVEPDLLATYFPWLQAVALALFAALWEESVFRAVPLACAALIGARYGGRSLWVWGAVVVQAVVFAAGHANYPQQPAYARVVELSLPALVWGAVYVRYGLVPTITAHFLYDLTLISSLLFVSDAPVDQGVIVAVGAIPLAVVLWARRGGRATGAPPEWARNAAWSPPERAPAAPGPTSPAAAAPTEPAAPPGAAPDGVAGAPARPEDAGAAGGARVAIPRLVVPLAGALGLALWVLGLALAEGSPRLEVDRARAIGVARGAIARPGLDVSAWTPAATASDGRGSSHAYVFEEAGPEAFDSLLGVFLAPPQWIVRFVDWEAEPAERVEELVVNIGPDGAVRRVLHVLPEARAGASLDQASAGDLARAALPPGSWTQVGAEETTHERRSDWLFTYREPSFLTAAAAEARASVTVLGDEVTDVRRFVRVPEEWERARREADSRRVIASGGLLFGLVLLFAAAAVVAIVVWSRGGLETAPLVRAGVAAGAAMALSTANGWQQTPALFSTAQPYGFQAGGAAIGAVLLVIVAAAGIGLVAALGHSWADAGGRVPPPRFLGVAVGLLVAGVASAASALSGGLPPTPGYSGAAAFVPVLAAPLDAIVPYLAVTAAVVALAVTHRRWAERPRLRSVTAFAILALGAVVVPDALRGSALAWVASGALGAAAVFGLVTLVGAFPALGPTILATSAALSAVGTALQRAYPGSLAGGLLSAGALAALGWAWSRALSRAAWSPEGGVGPAR